MGESNWYTEMLDKVKYGYTPTASMVAIRSHRALIELDRLHLVMTRDIYGKVQVYRSTLTLAMMNIETPEQLLRLDKATMEKCFDTALEAIENFLRQAKPYILAPVTSEQAEAANRQEINNEQVRAD